MSAARLGGRTDATAIDGSAGPVHDPGCSGGESFALRVLGDDMAPEFRHGEIIIVEPDGALKDGSFVLARHAGEWIFRQLCRRGAGWVLHALNPARPECPTCRWPAWRRCTAW
jgi:SOS-response transcriptional repressor LexA